MSLEKEHVLIVGGSSGIGLGVAEAVLKHGATVTVASRSKDKLRAAKEHLAADHRVRTIAADVTDEEQVQSLFAGCGEIDHLIVTRGVVPFNAPVGSMDLEAARRFIDLVIVSALALAKHAVSKLRRGGSITFTSGISKDKPGPGSAVVSTVAGAMGYLARALAIELAPTRVNVVSPGWVQTPMWDELAGRAKEEIWSDMARRLPAGRIATPADVAKAYTFLLGSELTTGTVLEIDGGHALI
jgi:NAD(P)-dependent dehydrogenase (short-subunit alcohol dehydrogenase family)